MAADTRFEITRKGAEEQSKLNDTKGRRGGKTSDLTRGMRARFHILRIAGTSDGRIEEMRKFLGQRMKLKVKQTDELVKSQLRKGLIRIRSKR